MCEQGAMHACVGRWPRTAVRNQRLSRLRGTLPPGNTTPFSIAKLQQARGGGQRCVSGMYRGVCPFPPPLSPGICLLLPAAAAAVCHTQVSPTAGVFFGCDVM